MVHNPNGNIIHHNGSQGSLNIVNGKMMTKLLGAGYQTHMATAVVPGFQGSPGQFQQRMSGSFNQHQQ
jgi:hypothetical protein